MNLRQQEMLRILLIESDEYTLVQELAERFDCSEKTVRNDFKEIENHLEEQSTARLIKKPGLGVYLKIEKKEKVRLFNQLAMLDDTLSDHSNDQRRVGIAYQILIRSKPATIKELASRYFVSTKVIRKDIEKIKAWLQKMNLNLISKQKVGLIVEGLEKNIRLALSELTKLSNRPDSVVQFIQEKFTDYEVDTVSRELRQLQERHHLSFTDETFERLLIHVLVMVRRVKGQQTISVSDKEKEVLQEKMEYQWAGEFLARIGKVFIVRFPPDEISYLAYYILGAKFRSNQIGSGPATSELSDHPVLNRLIEALVKSISELALIDFSRDKNLIEGLHLHLYSALNRLDYGLQVKNPMVNEIKKMYPYMFDMVIYSLEETKKNYQITIPEEEAAYLTLHFQASIERLNNSRDRKKRTIVVCHMGIGMSQLLRIKLEGKFPNIDIKESIAKADLKTYLSNNEVDFIISTIPLENVEVPFIVISPLLQEQEINKLSSFISHLDKPKVGQGHSVIASLTNPSLILMDLNDEHYYEIIEKMADTLAKQGYVDKNYAHSALKRERASATYIGSEIAIPHGDPALIKKPAIAIATFKESIKWGDDWASLIFMLAVPNDKQEVTKELFVQLSNLAEQPTRIQQLVNETDKAALISYL